MIPGQRRTLSTDDFEALRRHPAVLLSYCGLRTVIRAAERAGSVTSGLAVFIVPPGYRLDDYALAAGFFFERDTIAEWANPGTRKRVFQVPDKSQAPVKHASPMLSVFDLGQDTFLIARDTADIPEDVGIAANVVMRIPAPSIIHIQAARRLLGNPSLPKEVVTDLAGRSQEILLAGILRRDLRSADLPGISVCKIGLQPSLQMIPGVNEERPRR